MTAPAVVDRLRAIRVVPVIVIDSPRDALPLAAADYKLGLGGVNVLDGKAKPAGSVPANGSRSVTLPVSVTYENLLSAEQAIRAGGGDVPYDLDGGLSRVLSGELTKYRTRRRWVTKQGVVVSTAITSTVLRAPDGRPQHSLVFVDESAE